MYCYVRSARRICDGDNVNGGGGGLFIKREYICYTVLYFATVIYYTKYHNVQPFAGSKSSTPQLYGSRYIHAADYTAAAHAFLPELALTSSSSHIPHHPLYRNPS